MAQITRVKAAQQRYEMVPVLGSDGQPVRTAVKGKDGKQKTDKRGNAVFMTKTVADKTKPLPPETCGKCGKTIEVGTPYKHISPRSGPYGGRRLVRCADCLDWHVWEYSSSLSARLEEISWYFWENISEVKDPDDVQSALDDAAQAVHDLADEKRESANNIEEGFQHATYQSDELNELADNLDSWADEISSADIPQLGDLLATDCEACQGTGEVAVKPVDPASPYDLRNPEHVTVEACGTCDGHGQVTPDEYTAEQLEEWRDEVRSQVTIVDEAPI